MLRGCEQSVEKLGKVLWQTKKLYTVYSQVVGDPGYVRFLYTGIRTGFAQFYSAFTQPDLLNFNLSATSLYPVSTKPINNTNLIKD